MFYLTGSSTQICSIALNLLVIVAFFWFSTILSIIYDSKEIVQLKYNMIKISVIIIQNVNIFHIYETLYENVITILPITYQNKTKMPRKNWKYMVYLLEVASYINYVKAICIIFGGTG